MLESEYVRVAAKRLSPKCCRGVLHEFCKGGSEGHAREVLGLWGSEGSYSSLGVEKTVAEKSVGKLSKESCKKFCVYVESVLLVN